MTPDSLYTYYETGEYKDGVTIQDVESWIKSTSTTDDLPRILDALSHSQTNKGTTKKASKSTPKKPTASECKKTGQLAGQHFKNIQREEVLSAKEAWKLFQDQESIKHIKTEHLNGILDLFRGEETFTLDMYSHIGFEYGGCPVLKAFRTMSDLPLESEHVQLVLEAELYIAHLASEKNKKFEIYAV